MTALPISPGLGPGWYQPASCACSSGGTCTVPSGFVLREMIRAFTPIRGIVMVVGSDRSRAPLPVRASLPPADAATFCRGSSWTVSSMGASVSRSEGAAPAMGCGGRTSGVVFSDAPIIPAPSMASSTTNAVPAARHGDP
jgi:hypothetical protein